MVSLHVDIIGRGSPPLVLLHGLGVNGAAWNHLISVLKDWPGRIIVPDLRGHGRSPHARPYTLGHHAGDVASLLRADESVYVIGHSMGGMIGLALASGWFGIDVAYVLAFGVKVNWQAAELARLKKTAAAPPRWFATRADAVERFLRVSGLIGVVPADAAVVEVGVVPESGGFRLAADPATTLVTGPEIGPILKTARAKWQLICGERDPLVGIAELRAHDPHAIEIAGCGHNPHIEAPAFLASLIFEARTRLS